ncbi:MAG: transcription antitermination factor NusB [Desulfomonile tiedjei]|nr:transcription antitermination factor NusB [Desulfomonile tiedjei]
MPSRRKTREFVLQVLFAADARKEDPADTLQFLESHFSSDPEQVLKMHRVTSDFARELVSAVAKDRAVIDALIDKLSLNWKVHRMNRVDLNILRMAIAEMLNFTETPDSVILNEAIDIGKKYGAENSAGFINGILDRIHRLKSRPASAEQFYDTLMSLDELEPTD